MLCSISGPFLLSFDSRVAFYKKWKYLPISIFFPALIFIAWDILFVKLGVWEFNPKYVIGINLFTLPLEEHMFFIFIPYACIFVYECTNYYIKKDFLATYSKMISTSIIVAMLVIVLIFSDRLYTTVTFSLFIITLFYLQYIQKAKWLGRFYVGYLFSFLPFLIVNGILTSFPVVIYNNTENLGFRIGTIPVEDTFYGMLLILLSTAIYEKLKVKSSQ